MNYLTVLISVNYLMTYVIRLSVIDYRIVITRFCNLWHYLLILTSVLRFFQ